MSKQYKISLIQAILSIIFSAMIWIVVFCSFPALRKLPDTILVCIALFVYTLTFFGAIMAINAKKNNIECKNSIIYISALGMLLSAFDIFTYFVVIYAMIVGTFFTINDLNKSLVGIFIMMGIFTDIILCRKYIKTKPSC